jgi:hypothetical protein
VTGFVKIRDRGNKLCKTYDALCGIVFKKPRRATPLWATEPVDPDENLLQRQWEDWLSGQALIGRCRLMSTALGVPPGYYFPFFKQGDGQDAPFSIMDFEEPDYPQLPLPALKHRAISRTRKHIDKLKF